MTRVPSVALPDPSSGPARELPLRHGRARARLDLRSGRGLEIGPLFDPLVGRDEADVRYVDIRSTAELRDHYRDDPAVPIDRIVDVDYVLVRDETVLSLPEACAEGTPFQWVVASHVIEHVPDLIGWLADLAAIMDDGARLSLVVPDRRYCFDALRPATTVGDMLLAHDSADSRPSVRAVFDHFSSCVRASLPDLWEGRTPATDSRIYTTDQALELVNRSRQGEYVDSHVWLFTPGSFVEQLDQLSALGALDFTVVHVLPTARMELEFYVTLERLPRWLTPGGKRERFVGSLPAGAGQLASIGQSDPDPSLAAVDGTPRVELPLVLSEHERRLIGAKRAVLGRYRRLLRTIRT